MKPPSSGLPPLATGPGFGRAESGGPSEYEAFVMSPHAAHGDLFENRVDGLYIILISMHGLIRGEKMELGKDADTGGQVSCSCLSTAL